MRRMFKSKFAMWNVVLGMIVVLAGAAVLGAITFQIHKKLSGADKMEKCRLSILANDQLGRYAESGRESVVNFDCERQLIEIELEDVETNGRIDDSKVKSILADEMKSCWDMVGQGKLDPFRNWGMTNEKFCLVCSDIVFKPDVLEQSQDQAYALTGFHYFVVSRRLFNTEGTLYQYIRGSRMPAEGISVLAATESHPGSTFNMAKRYNVIWRMEKIQGGLSADVVGAVQMQLDALTAAQTYSQRGFNIMPSRLEMGEHSGAGFGLGIQERDTWRVAGVETPEGSRGFKFQDVFILPEDAVSGPLQFGDTQIDFCTFMVN